MAIMVAVYYRPVETRNLGAPGVVEIDIIVIEPKLLVAGFNLLSDLKVAEEGRFFAAQTSGLIRIGKSDGTILSEPFLDLSDLVEPISELGISSIALHPQFETNGRFFVNYTTTEFITYIAGYEVSDDNPDVSDLDSCQEILTIEQN